VLGYTKDNFALSNHDFQKFRDLFNLLVETHIPNEFQSLREKLKEAFINAELRLTNLESVVEEHNRKFQEASDFCQKLRKDFDHMQNSVPQGSTEPTLLLQAGLGDANKNIRDLHEKFQ
jgi:hypothetical protein